MDPGLKGQFERLASEMTAREAGVVLKEKEARDHQERFQGLFEAVIKPALEEVRSVLDPQGVHLQYELRTTDPGSPSVATFQFQRGGQSSPSAELVFDGQSNVTVRYRGKAVDAHHIDGLNYDHVQRWALDLFDAFATDFSGSKNLSPSAVRFSGLGLD